MDFQKLLLPGSIVLAGALIGAGLYFGLRAEGRGEGPAPPPAEVSPERSGASSSSRALPSLPGQGAPAGAPRPMPPEDALPARPPVDPISPEVHAAAIEQASASLAAHRSRLIRECWEPSAKKAGSPAKVTVPMRLLFHAQGKETSRALGNAREPGREDVVACLRAAQFPLSIRPPGMLVGVQLTLTLP